VFAIEDLSSLPGILAKILKSYIPVSNEELGPSEINHTLSVKLSAGAKANVLMTVPNRQACLCKPLTGREHDDIQGNQEIEPAIK